MDEPACPGCRELSKQVAELTAQVAELTRKLDKAVRAGKRQAAPYRKGPPKPEPGSVAVRMKYFLSTELPRLAGWGATFAAGLTRAEEDYFSAHARRSGIAPREPSEGSWAAADREMAEAQARGLVHYLRMSDPAAFTALGQEFPLSAFLRRQWYPSAPGEFLASLEELLPLVHTIPPDQVRTAEDVSVLDLDRRPSDPLPIAYGTGDEPTANQRAVFARLVRDEGAVEQRLIDEISLWYLSQAEYLGEALFGRRPGEAVYLPGDPSEDDFRRLALVREIHLAPSTCRLAVVFEVSFLIDPEHGTLCTALVEEFEYVRLGGGDELVWMV